MASVDTALGADESRTRGRVGPCREGEAKIGWPVRDRPVLSHNWISPRRVNVVDLVPPANRRYQAAAKALDAGQPPAPSPSLERALHAERFESKGRPRARPCREGRGE